MNERRPILGFVVTSLTRAECEAAIFTEKVYCARGDRVETGSRNASLIFMPIAPRPPPCGQTSCACGLPRWPMCCCAPCAASPCTTRRSPKRPAAHSSQAAQDRRPRARECPPHQGCDGVSVSGSPYLGLHCQASPLPANARASPALTHVAATRNPRGITPGPPRPLRDFRSQIIVQALSRLQTPRRTASAEKPTACCGRTCPMVQGTVDIRARATHLA